MFLCQVPLRLEQLEHREELCLVHLVQYCLNDAPVKARLVSASQYLRILLNLADLIALELLV